jgi:hypothetical protein
VARQYHQQNDEPAPPLIVSEDDLAFIARTLEESVGNL